ncbi:epimerase [Dactylosporangium fulvum]|uniref:Epimerase n=1 Tax=Dactylosporangium fulvum TaxID=53359 RepID=A0ABY5VVU8_9ACTN|nr:NAD-dependent epimerase/dehydratase family protein [Dactylosporangium fulvum]UWP80608.1 epimerase [Dactylosporangium fulvum]
MKVIVFGATGMVGQGVLRECLLADDVDEVLAVTRSPLGQQHPKLRELRHPDFTDFSGVDFGPYDACFYCLGVSSVGMSEADYHRITYDYTLAAARVMAAQHPGMTFVFVSGAGTDTNSRQMWARVKGRTEDDVRALDLRVYAFRPGFIRPMHGARSKVRLYRALYVAFTPLSALLVRLAPGIVTTTEQIGRAMLRVAREGSDKHVLQSRDIAAL